MASQVIFRTLGFNGKVMGTFWRMLNGRWDDWLSLGFEKVIITVVWRLVCRVRPCWYLRYLHADWKRTPLLGGPVRKDALLCPSEAMPKGSGPEACCFAHIPWTGARWGMGAEYKGICYHLGMVQWCWIEAKDGGVGWRREREREREEDWICSWSQSESGDYWDVVDGQGDIKDVLKVSGINNWVGGVVKPFMVLENPGGAGGRLEMGEGRWATWIGFARETSK